MVRPRPAVEALPAYKPGRNPADLAREIGVERAVKLASNEVAFPPLPGVVRALATAAAETNRYPDNGALVLTSALAQRYGVDPAQVVTGCGAVMLCQQLAQSFNDPGTSMAFAWRSFEMYPLLAQVAGARAIQVPLVPGRPGGPADTHDLEALAAAVDESTRLVFVCNPNNPTGTAVRRAGAGAVPRRRPASNPRRPRRGVPRVRHRPRRPRRPGADAGAAERRRAAHLLEGVGAGGPAGRLPGRRGPRGGRGSPRRTCRSASPARPGGRGRGAGQRGRGARPVRRGDRRARPAHRRPAGARPGRRRQPGQLRLAADGGADGGARGRARGPGGDHPAVRRGGHPGHGRHARGGRRLPRRARRGGRRLAPPAVRSPGGAGTGEPDATAARLV